MSRHLLFSCVGFAALMAASPVFANEDLMKMSQNPKDWVIPAGNYASQRYTALKQINAENVKNLTPAWTFSTGVLRGHEGGPLIIGNIMYVHTPFPNIVYALDLDHDGRIIWKYEPKQDPNVIPVMCCDTVNRGVAYGDGMIFLHQADTTLVALDAKTGAVKWQAKDGDPSKGATGTSAPLVVKNEVLVGVSGGEFGVRGYVTAYDITRQREMARLFDGPGQRHADRSREDHRARQTGRQGSQPFDMERRSMEDRWRRHLGLVLL